MSHEFERISAGVEGLDEVLHGGFIPERSYMVTGDPGAGKTILGLHFLTAGVEAAETPLSVGLEESEADVRANAAALGQRRADDEAYTPHESRPDTTEQPVRR